MSVPPEDRWSFGQALRLAPALPALTNVVVVLVVWRLPTAGPHVRALHLLFTSAELAALGLLFGALADLWQRFLPTWAKTKHALLFLTTSAAGFFFFDEDTVQLGDWARVAVAAGVGACAALLPIAGRVCGRFRVARVLALAAAVAAAIANHFILRINYPGAHLALAVASVLGVALALAGLRRPLPLPRRARDGALWLACVLAAASLVHRPSGTIALELARDESAAFYRFVAPLYGSRYTSSLGAVTAESRPWFTSREGAADVPPSAQRPALSRPLVLLLTIDAFRYDFWKDPENARHFVNLKRLAAQSVEFENAHATGSTTVPSISSIHSGLYYSQRYWTRTPFRSGNRFFLTRDTQKGLCDYLNDAGVETATVPSTDGLKQSFGVVRGCETTLGPPFEGTRYSADVMPPLLEWIDATGKLGNALVYTHFLDGHDPYDLAGTAGSDRERQLRELALVDAQIGALVKELRRTGAWSRAVILVTSDHGESHGDHGAKFHGGNVYEELTRVPMLIRVPGVAPRKVEVPVSGIDVAPTVLDLFELATPGHLLGQSLVPLLVGADVQLTRPVVLDSAKQQRALLFPDGIKVIHKARESAFEIYDLNADPGETKNLVDDYPDADARIGALVAFFEAHTFRKFGYRIPSR